MSDSLWLHGLQHTRLLCSSSNPGACSNSCPFIESVMPSNHLIDCHPLLLPSTFPSIRVISITLIMRKALLSLLAILWNFVFRWVYLSFSPLPFASFLFTEICNASSESHFGFLHFFFLGMVLITVSCKMSQTSVHRFSGTLSIRSSPLNLFVISTV